MRPARPFGKSLRARGSAASRYRTQERRETGSTVSSYYEYDAANQLTQVHDLPADTWNYFAYDTRGNCLRALDTSGSAYFAWTSADLVDKIRWADGKANYFYYDARLRRFGMRDSDGLRYFTWDSGGMNLIAERSGAKAQTAAYAHGRTRLFRFDPARARR